MNGSIRIFLVAALFVACVATFSGVAAASYVAVKGGCIFHHDAVSVKINSASENTAVAQYLRTAGLASAGLASYVSAGRIYWEDGSSAKWKPSSFKVDQSDIGFVVVHSDGSWVLGSYDDYVDTSFMCDVTQSGGSSSSGGGGGGSNHTNSSSSGGGGSHHHNVTSSSSSSSSSSHRDVSHTVPVTEPAATATESQSLTLTHHFSEASSSSSSSSSEAAEVPTMTVEEILAEIAAAVGAGEEYHTVAYAASAISTVHNLSALTWHQMQVHIGYGATFGVAFDCSSSGSSTFAAVQLHSVSQLLFFQLPVSLTQVESGVMSHTVCAAARTSDATKKFVSTSSSVKVHSLYDRLVDAKAHVTLLEEDLMAKEYLYKKLDLFEGDARFSHVQAASYQFTESLTLSMINNGERGKPCVATTRTLEYFQDGARLVVRIPVGEASTAKLGRRSICASVPNRPSRTIAVVQLHQFHGVADSEKYAYGSTIPVVVHGASQASFARNTLRYTAFLAHTRDCSTPHSKYPVTLENALALNTPTYSPSTTPGTHTVAGSEDMPTVYLSPTLSATGSTPKLYLCMRNVQSKKLFPVVSAEDGDTVYITGTASVKGGPAGSGVVQLLEGMIGPLNLVELVPTSAGTAASQAIAALKGTGSKVRFVSIDAFVDDGSSTTMKTAACTATAAAEATGAQIGRYAVMGVYDTTSIGTIQMSTKLKLPSGLDAHSGVICVGEMYVLVDFELKSKRSWLAYIGGTNDTVRRNSEGNLLAILSAVTTTDVLVVETTDDSISSTFTLRLAPVPTQTSFASDTSTVCQSGENVKLSYQSAKRYIAHISTASSNSALLCVGLHSETSGTSIFAPISSVLDASVVSFLSFTAAVEAWKSANNVEESIWDIASNAGSVCGNEDANVIAVQVRDAALDTSLTMTSAGAGASTTLAPSWPTLYASYFMTATHLSIQIRTTTSYANPAIVVDGTRPYILFSVNGETYSLNRICADLNYLVMSADGAHFGTTVTVSAHATLVRLRQQTAILGLEIAVVPISQPSCANAGSSKLLSSVAVWNDALGCSVVDLAEAVWLDLNEYYVFCARIGNSWSAVPTTYLSVTVATTQTSTTADVEVDGILTGMLRKDADEIHLWNTETATWGLTGVFVRHTPITMSLMWNSATCSGTPAYVARTKYISSVSSEVVVKVSQITAAPDSSSRLYACYIIGTSTTNAVWSPLHVEKQRGRAIAINPLRLRSFNYIPVFALRRDTTVNTTLMLTDPSGAPIASLLVFRARTVSDTSARAGCTPGSKNHVATLNVAEDVFGVQRITVEPAVTSMYYTNQSTTYLLMCATGTATASEASYVPVSAYMTIDKIGTNMSLNAAALNFYFTQLNGSQTTLDLDAASLTLQEYVMNVQNGTTVDQILISEKTSNIFSMYIVAASATVLDVFASLVSAIELAVTSSLVSTAEEAARTLFAVYTAIKNEEKIPIQSVASSSPDNATFAVLGVEGVFVLNQTTYGVMPYISVKTTTTTDEEEHDTTKIAIALLCIVIIPVALGFVVFSVERKIPTLVRSGKGKKTESDADGEGAKKEGATSPLPRDPLATDTHEKEVEMEDVAVTVTPKAEDTTANPLYDDSDSDGERRTKPVGRNVLGASPAGNPAMGGSVNSEEPPTLAATAQQKAEPSFLTADF